MKKAYAWPLGVLAAALLAAYLVLVLVRKHDREDRLHYERGETELAVSNLSGGSLTLLRADKSLADTVRVASFNGNSIWLTPGNYFIRDSDGPGVSYIPVSLTGYRCGPDKDGSFNVTVRPLPGEFPPRVDDRLPGFLYVPGGSSLLGDKLNPREPHYVWLTGFFIAPFEVTNGEFRKFLAAPDGFISDSDWTDGGRRWKTAGTAHNSALLTPDKVDYPRFGRDDQPITWITWYEANAYCKWLTRTLGGTRWLYTLPNEAEWEKAARGPDNLDYALSMTVSDDQISLYNWRKNPDAPVTVVGIGPTGGRYRPNRFGAYHMTGNVVEWTQSINRPFSRENPFIDDDRNSDDLAGLRVARGGSWYSASIAYLYIPYRDAFQPEHSTQDIGFRIAVKALP